MFSFAVLNDSNHYAEYNYAVGVKKIVIFYSLIAVKMHVFFYTQEKIHYFYVHSGKEKNLISVAYSQHSFQ